MIHTLAISNYRSIRNLTLSLGQLNMVTGPNGSGKSNLYRGLRLLCDVAQGDAIQALALERGLESVLWAGPESISRAMKQGSRPVQGGPRQEPIALRLGFANDSFGYAIDFGLPSPVPRTMFDRDPEIKREVIWYGESWHERRAMVDRNGPHFAFASLRGWLELRRSMLARKAERRDDQSRQATQPIGLDFFPVWAARRSIARPTAPANGVL